jgi:ParB family transcriptional regulator, chromosome partitioning protein
MARDRERLEELDAAIAGLSRPKGEGEGATRRRSVVAIGEQVRAVAAATGEAYTKLKAEMERAVAEGRLVIEVNPTDIRDTSYRDRDEAGFHDQAFTDLLTSIEREGQLAPAALRQASNGSYEVVFGHRRVRVARALGRKLKAVVLDGDDTTLLRRMITENAVRRDLSPLEKARAWHRLLTKNLFTRQELADLLKVSPQQVSNITALAALSDELLESLGDWRTLAINEGRRLLTAWEAAGRHLPKGLAEELRSCPGDATARARLLVRRLRRASSSEESRSELIRARDGRKLARLTHSGAQLVIRFQPDLDEARVRLLARRLPELWETLE